MSLSKRYARQLNELKTQLLSIDHNIDCRIRELARLGEQKEQLIDRQIELKKQFEADWWASFLIYLRTGK